MKNVVVIGGSIAGVSSVRALRGAGYDGRVTVVEREDGAPYRKPELSKGLLVGKFDVSAMSIAWPQDLAADRLVGVEATGVDLDSREVLLREGGQDRALSFDGLVIATGSEPRRHSQLGQDAGVFVVRTLADTHALAQALAAARSLVVVGGGFLGLEVASSARQLDVDVTVIESAPSLFGGRFGPELSERLSRLHADHGVTVRTGESVDQLELVRGRVAAVRLGGSGGVIDTDVVVWSTGAYPAAEWLRESKLATPDGVICRPDLSVVGAPGVVAAGDVARWHNHRFDVSMRIEHWSNAIEHGGAAARALLGKGSAVTSLPYVWSHQHGWKFESVGCPYLGDRIEMVDSATESLVVGFYRGDVLVGACSLASGVSPLAPYRRQIQRDTEPSTDGSAARQDLPSTRTA